MNSNLSSKLVALVLLATVLVAGVAPAAAISADAEDAPSDAKVGEKVTATFTLTELYTDYEQWTLSGQTQLEDVTWTVTRYDQADNKVGQTSYDGRSFNQSISLENNVDEVSVKVTGAVPEIETYSYDPAQSITLAALNQTRTGGNTDEIESWTVHTYTDESEQARAAIESAAAAIEDAKGSSSVTEAENSLDGAISAYENGNFELANSLAATAEEKANSSKQSSQTKSLLVKIGGGVLTFGLLIGGVFWWRSQQDSYDKLG